MKKPFHLNYQENSRYSHLWEERSQVYYLFPTRYAESENIVLYYLYCHQENVTQQEICEQTSINKQTLNSAVKRLRANGLIEAEVSSECKREKLLHLTSVGRDAFEKSVAPLLEAEENALLRMTSEEREQYYQLYEQHTHYLQEELQRAAENK